MDETTAQLGAQLGGWATGAVGVIVLLSVLLDRLSKVTDSGGNLVSRFLAARRRVAAERQDAAEVDRSKADEAVRREIEGLGRSVDRLQRQVNRQEQQIEDLRADNAEIHAYAWRAYDRVLKHEPDTDFPSPREHMAAAARAFPPIPQEPA